MYCVDNGRPNPVQTVLGVPKEMFNLTDDEALARVQPALAPRPAALEETQPQKTLHLPSSPDAARRWPAGFPGDQRIIQALGIRTGQRLSTHIMSIAPGWACSVRRRALRHPDFALGFRRAS